MCEFSSDLNPMIVNSHDKGVNRGISIYFGINELNELEKQGIDLKNNRKFIVKATLDNNLVLIPLSQVDSMLDMQNMEGQLDRILSLTKSDMNDFVEDLISIITEEKIDISANERYSVYQITKGHYTRHNLRNAIRMSMRVNKKETQELINNYV